MPTEQRICSSCSKKPRPLQKIVYIQLPIQLLLRLIQSPPELNCLRHCSKITKRPSFLEQLLDSGLLQTLISLIISLSNVLCTLTDSLTPTRKWRIVGIEFVLPWILSPPIEFGFAIKLRSMSPSTWLALWRCSSPKNHHDRHITVYRGSSTISAILLAVNSFSALKRRFTVSECRYIAFTTFSKDLEQQNICLLLVIYWFVCLIRNQSKPDGSPMASNQYRRVVGCIHCM